MNIGVINHLWAALQAHPVTACVAAIAAIAGYLVGAVADEVLKKIFVNPLVAVVTALPRRLWRLVRRPVEYPIRVNGESLYRADLLGREVRRTQSRLRSTRRTVRRVTPGPLRVLAWPVTWAIGKVLALVMYYRDGMRDAERVIYRFEVPSAPKKGLQRRLYLRGATRWASGSECPGSVRPTLEILTA